MKRRIRHPQIEQPAGTQDPPHLPQGVTGLRQVVQHIDAGDCLSGRIGQGTGGPALPADIEAPGAGRSNRRCRQVETDAVPPTISTAAQQRPAAAPDIDQKPPSGRLSLYAIQDVSPKIVPGRPLLLIKKCLPIVLFVQSCGIVPVRILSHEEAATAASEYAMGTIPFGPYWSSLDTDTGLREARRGSRSLSMVLGNVGHANTCHYAIEIHAVTIVKKNRRRFERNRVSKITVHLTFMPRPSTHRPPPAARGPIHWFSPDRMPEPAPALLDGDDSEPLRWTGHGSAPP